MEDLKKISLSFWKNLLGLKVKWLTYACVFLLHIALFVFLKMSLDRFTKDFDAIIFKPFSVDDGPIENQKIAWSPCANKKLKDIMKGVAAELTLEEICYNNSYFLDSFSKMDKTIFCAVQFNDKLAKDNLIPKVANVILRFNEDDQEWLTAKVFPVEYFQGPRDYTLNTGASPEYQQRGFLRVQKAVTLGIMKYFSDTEMGVEHWKKIKIPKLNMQRFPHPSWKESDTDVLNIHIMIVTSLFVILMLLFVVEIATEKETQIEEALKIMGMKNWVNWTAWFLYIFIFLIICNVLALSVFCYEVGNDDPTITYTNFRVLFLIFTINAVVLIVTLFFTTTVVKNVFMCQQIYLIVTYFPVVYICIHPDLLTSSSLTKLIFISFLPNGGLAIIVKITYEERIKEGINFGNMFALYNRNINFTCGHVVILMLVYCCLFMVLTFYFEAVLPKKYGIRKPWYFLFTRDFWRQSKMVVRVNAAPKQNNEFEDEPQDMKPGIQIDNVSKSFGKFEAVKGITLNMYEDQITCLLGHNAAGKSTTFSMITGMITPTSGRIIVNGYDIVKNTQEARKGVGFCPQNNVLFDNLTIKQHFYLFAKLKGVKNDLDEEIQKYITLLNLEDKKNTLACKLSGGMKRKLSIGIAMIGNTKIVLLDEPTAGIDPLARRHIWNTLQREKYGRTILLTTHYMDEADLLSDRIAIMADGQIEAYGSTLYLKKKYDSGYQLVIEKNDKCDVNNVTKFLKNHLAHIKHESTVGSELKYTLKKEDASHFDALFKDLEANRDKLNILTFGVAMATIEDVFLKTGVKKEDNKAGQKLIVIANTEYHQGKKYYLYQIWTLVYKRMLIIKRSWISLLLQFLFLLAPIIYEIITMDSKSRYTTASPLMDIDFSKYDEPITLVSGNGKYKETFIKSVGKNSTKIEDIGTLEINAHALTIAGEDIQKYKQHYIVGMSFSDEEITTWFNNQPYHSPPLALQCALNAIVKKEIGPSYEIKISNHPLYKARNNMVWEKSGFTFISYMIYLSASMFAIFYTTERVVGAKHLQIVAGVHPILFWMVALSVDFLIYLIMLIPCLIFMRIYEVAYVTSDKRTLMLFLLLALFGLCTLFMCVFFSRIEKIPIKAAMYVFLFHMISILFYSMIKLSKAIKAVQQGKNKRIEDKSLEEQRAEDLQIYNWFPSASLHEGLEMIVSESFTKEFCKSLKESCDLHSAAYAVGCNEQICKVYPRCCIWRGIFSQYAYGIGTQLLKLSIVLSISMVLLFVFSTFGVLNFPFGKKSKHMENEDEDVRRERLKINAINKDFDAYNLILKTLSKKYGFCKKNYAVKNVSFGIPSYECFGLLGANGAGKTTIFNMITGKEASTSGKIYTKGFDMSRKKFKIFKLIGYCPQFDALLGDLTCEETLIIFAMLHGITRKDSKLVAEQMAIDFQFEAHLNKLVKKCSGGTKRKLSTAVSMLGDPKIIYLDEPSAGMDPVTRKFIWGSINNARDNGKTVVLTSHSMEEVEALCTRVAIMVEGQLKCLGPIQHLKSKFVPGYTMIIKTKKVSPERTEANFKSVHSFITSNFPRARLTEHYREMSTYMLESGGSLSKIFNLMEGAKQSLNIEDYVVSQGSLEQVFIKICTEEHV